MSVGTAMRAGITSAINQLGSTLTITPYTDASQTSGYGGQVETSGTAVTETAIPFEELKTILKQKFGDVETGKFQLALKSTAVFDISGSTKYKVTWNSEVYDIEKDRRYVLNDTVVAYIINLSKRID